MQNSDWLKIKEVFVKTLTLPRNERESFLAKHSALIESEVRELIKSHEEADDFIAEPAAVELGFSQDINIGQVIDNYKIVAIIGEGGMGNVYLAERIGFEQKVALKLIKRGMDTRQVLKRFKLERQILSRLNHPNIAKLLDGGETPEGLPYFVMEYIEGQPITKFCDKHQFDINERLELFQKVCNAITYAHQNLIIHRDLKPSNIIVTDDGTPKLLDFGIAKLVFADDSSATITQTQGRIFTPEYASPEQINGLPITTTTDVYSLGVVLYELLSGVRPFKTKSKNYAEIANQILTQEPQKPSSVVSGQWSVVRNTNENKAETQNESTNPKSKIQNPKSLIGDLDNIILKSIRKEPELRYQSIQEFSEDIKCHLNGLPVTATVDSRLYRLEKFVKRHKQGVAISVVVSLLILSLSGVAIWQSVLASEEKAKAERRLLETRKIANSLIFEIHDSLIEVPGATASRELLVKRSLEYLEALSKDSIDDPALQNEVAIAYRKVGEIIGGGFTNRSANLGNNSEAIGFFGKAADIHRNLHESQAGNSNLRREYAISLALFSEATYTEGPVDEALADCQLAQQQFEVLINNEPKDFRDFIKLSQLYSMSAELLKSKHEHSQASEHLKKAGKYNDEALLLAPENPDVLNYSTIVYSDIARYLGNPEYNDQGKPDEALIQIEKPLQIIKRLRELNPDNVSYKSKYGVAFRDKAIFSAAKKDFEAAIKNHEMASAIFEEIISRDINNALAKAHLAFNRSRHGVALNEVGKFNEAIRLQKQAIDFYQQLAKKNPESVGILLGLSSSLEMYADTLISNKRIGEALEIYRSSLSIMTKCRSKNASFETIIPLARVYLKIGKLEKQKPESCRLALEYFQKSYQMLNEFRINDRLSPSNTETLFEAKQLAENFVCS